MIAAYQMFAVYVIIRIVSVDNNFVVFPLQIQNIADSDST